MQFALSIKTEPASEPVTIAELKEHLRITGTDDDTRLTFLIVAAREAVENALRRTLMPTTYELFLDTFPDTIELLHPPFASVTSVKYIDTDGTEQTLAAANYRTDLKSIAGRIDPAYGTSWPSARSVSNAVTVEYVAGYADADSVPTAIKLAIISLACHLSEHPEALSEVKLEDNPAINLLKSRYRVPFIPYN